MLEIQAPDIAKPTGGLLGTLQPVTSGPEQIFRGVTYVGELCGHSRRVPAPGTEKTFDQLPIVTSAKFSIYRGVEMSMFEDDQVLGAVTDAYNRGKGWAVERAVQELLLNSRPDGEGGTVGAVDITPTPGTPVTNRRAALGLLQQYAADQYSGMPMIHTNRLGTSLLEPEIEEGVLATRQGVPVINGGGYGPTGPGGAVAPDGSAWAYIAGTIVLHEQEVQIQQTRGLKENRVYALAESTWVATVDCFVAAILVGT